MAAPIAGHGAGVVPPGPPGVVAGGMASSGGSAGSPEAVGDPTAALGACSPAGGSPGQEVADITTGMDHLSTHQPMHVKVGLFFIQQRIENCTEVSGRAISGFCFTLGLN